jgi:hypothetical protein
MSRATPSIYRAAWAPVWLALSLLLSGALVAPRGMAQNRPLTSADVSAARRIAQGLLEQIDGAPLSDWQLNNLYGMAGLALTERYTPAAFAARLDSVRAPLGAVRKRTYEGFSGDFTSLPNIIPGDYLILEFITRFEGRKRPYTEQVTLERDRSEAPTWRLVEYYVAPLAMLPAE